MLPEEEIHMEKIRAGKVGEKHTERDGKQKKRFELLFDRKVKQYSYQNVHYERLDQQDRIGDQLRYSRGSEEIKYKFQRTVLLSLDF